jgi:hypothetical protein
MVVWNKYACGSLYQLKRIVLMKGKVSDHSQNLWIICGEILNFRKNGRKPMPVILPLHKKKLKKKLKVCFLSNQWRL